MRTLEEAVSRDPDALEIRVQAFLELVPEHGPVQFLALPGVDPTRPGHCCSCGTPSTDWRCTLCVEAIRLAFQRRRPADPRPSSLDVVARVLKQLDARGVTLYLEGGQLKFRGRAGAYDEQWKRIVNLYRQDIIAVLTDEPPF